MTLSYPIWSCCHQNLKFLGRKLSEIYPKFLVLECYETLYSVPSRLWTPSSPLSLQLLQTSRWFRRRRAVGFDRTGGAIKSNCPSSSKSSRSLYKLHDEGDEGVHTSTWTEYSMQCNAICVTEYTNVEPIFNLWLSDCYKFLHWAINKRLLFVIKMWNWIHCYSSNSYPKSIFAWSQIRQPHPNPIWWPTLILTLTGSWIRSRLQLDRIQLPIVVESGLTDPRQGMAAVGFDGHFGFDCA